MSGDVSQFVANLVRVANGSGMDIEQNAQNIPNGTKILTERGFWVKLKNKATRENDLEQVVIFKIKGSDIEYFIESKQWGKFLLDLDYSKVEQLKSDKSKDEWMKQNLITIPGSVYKHYKGTKYVVKGIILDHNDASPWVLYAQYSKPELIWLRKLDVWDETLPETQEKRFTLVKNEFVS